MIKNLLVLLVFTFTLNSCTGGCPDDCCLGDPCYDEKFKKTALEKPNISISISNICDINSPDYKVEMILTSCAEFDELDYDNIPPDNCEEITFKDLEGNNHTGLYINHIKRDDCN